jgi:hypothetical protein
MQRGPPRQDDREVRPASCAAKHDFAELNLLRVKPFRSACWTGDLPSFAVRDAEALARLTHEREVPCHLGSVKRHGEEEAQRRDRTVDARRTHAGLRLMQLETAKLQSREQRSKRPREPISGRIQACLQLAQRGGSLQCSGVSAFRGTAVIPSHPDCQSQCRRPRPHNVL